MRYFLLLISLLAQAAIHRPADSAALTTALSAAACGDLVVLTAGTAYRGSFSISNKACTPSTQLIIEGSRIAELPVGRQLTWAYQPLMPTIETVSANAAFTLGTNVQHVVIRGVAFSNYWPTSNTVTSDLVTSDGAIIAPKNVTFDRVMAYPYEETAEPGYPFRSAERFMTATGTEIAVRNSYITGFFGWYKTRVQQAISSVTGGATTTLNFTSVHGWGSSGTRVIYVEGGTGSWTGINEKRTATIVDTDTVTIPVDSSGFGPVTGTFTARDINSDALTLSRGLTFPVGPGPYRVVNNYIAAQYTSTFWGGATRTFTPNDFEITASPDGTHVTVASTVNLAVGDLIAISPNVLRVSTITSANPAVITFNRAHGLGSAGATYKLSFSPGSVTSTAANGVPPANGSWNGSWSGISGVRTVTVIDSTSVSIPVNSSGFAAYAGSQGGSTYGGVVGYDVNQSNDTINGCSPQNAGQGNNYCVYIVTAISGLDLTISPYGASGNGRSGAVWPGSRVRWNGTRMRNLEMRRNYFAKEPGWCTGKFLGACKGFDETKEWSGIWEGNRYWADDGTGYGVSGGLGLGPPRNQDGVDPWLQVSGSQVSYNLARLSAVGAGGFDDIRSVKTARHADQVIYRGNVILDTDGYCFKANSPMQLVYEHNTCWPQAYSGNSYNSWIQVIECGTYSGPGSIQLGMADALVRGNIGKYNLYGAPANGSNCRVDSTLDYNILINNQSVAGLPGIYFDSTNKFPADATAAGMTAGACNWDNWENCRIASGAYIGLAPGGKTPGADIDMAKDRINGWSEDAGLLEYGSGWQGALNRSAAFQLGSTRAAITFRRINSGACTLILYTDAIRNTQHADTDTGPEQDCARTGNLVNADGSIVFVLGTNSVLTASTTYHYKITQGSAVMVGSFGTRAAGSGLSPSWNKNMDCGADANYGTAVAAGVPYSISAGAVRYCRESGTNGIGSVIVAP